ncbi:MAG: hypothetical protein HY089_00675 [Ignavibacteriales bacterium]|nr:hypothetical protein [Ignavibacteriales bacterium]
MFETTRIKIGKWYAMVHFRGDKEPVMHFNDAVSQAKRVLVLLPESAQGASSIESVFRFFQQRFHTNRVLLVGRKDVTASLPRYQGFELITYAPEDLNAWFVPRPELLRKLKKSTFDIAFDLNIGFELPSAFLCRESKAPLRVSFAKLYADDFYNFQVRTAQTQSFTQAYLQLLKCLEMF